MKRETDEIAYEVTRTSVRRCVVIFVVKKTKQLSVSDKLIVEIPRVHSL